MERSMADIFTAIFPHYLEIMENRNGSKLGWTPWDNCSYPAILDYPDPGFPPGYSAILASLLLLISCIALARVCDKYFFPAVLLIVKRWGLKGDVVTAVIFASVASWPELAISVITVFDTQQAAVGVGSIVGTSVFNTLAIPAVCAFVLNKNSRADPATTTRDTIMAAVSFTFLALVLRDSIVGWTEALLMLLLYVTYIIVLKCFPSPQVIEPERQSLNKDGKKRTSSYSRTLYWAKSVFLTVVTIIISPIHCLLKMLIPPADKFPYLAVIFGVVYIALITYVIAWMITTLGYSLNIPNSLLSLTVLSVGLGYPDLISALKVAEQGTASEVLSNSLGACTFNILVSLGFPWFIKSSFFPDDDLGDVFLNFEGGMYSVDMMISTVLLLYAALVANSFRFNTTVGCICIGLYCSFLIIVTLLELNVFFPVNKPLCDIKDYYNDPS